MKVRSLTTTEEPHAGDLDDPEYRAEWERTHLAQEITMRVISYRVEHQLTQTELARRQESMSPRSLCWRVSRASSTWSFTSTSRGVPCASPRRKGGPHLG